MAHKKYDTVDYNDAHSHIMARFDENIKLKDASFTKEDVEGLAVILYDLRQKHDDPLDVWESNKVSDYVSNLESSYEMKMGKGGTTDIDACVSRCLRGNYGKGGTAKVKHENKKSSGEKIEGYLPVFTGFYGTIFEPQEDSVIEAPYTYDDYDFDYAGYNLEASKACVKVVEGWLENFDIKIKFQELVSPREYNFTNDSINVEYTIGKNTVKEILDYLEIEKEAFAKYIKERYTSRSGFISYYSNDSEEWIKDLKDGNKLHHVFGSVLEFILKQEGHDDHELYEDISGNVFLSGELKESVRDNEGYISEYAKKHYADKSQDEISEDVMKHFNEENIDYSEKTVRKIIKETFSEVENKSMKMFGKGGKAEVKSKSVFTDKFKEVIDYGDRTFYAKKFGKVGIDINPDDEESTDIPIVVVAEVQDMENAVSEKELEKMSGGQGNFTLNLSIMPEPKFISEKNISSAIESAGIDKEDLNDETILVEILNYMGGVPIINKDIKVWFKSAEEAEKYLKSEELEKILMPIQGMMGFYMDGAINRIGQSRWDFLRHMITGAGFYAKGGKLLSGLKSFFDSYSNDGGLIFGGYFGGGNKMEKGGKAGSKLRSAKNLPPNEKLELQVLKSSSGFNDGQSIGGMMEILGYNFQFQGATKSEYRKVYSAVKSLVKKEFLDGDIEHMNLSDSYKLTQEGADYLRSFDYGTYDCGGKMEKGGKASKDGDRRAYYIKAWKKTIDNIKDEKADYENKTSLNWDEAQKEQSKLEKKYDSVGIYRKKDNDEVSITLGKLGKGGKTEEKKKIGIDWSGTDYTTTEMDTIDDDICNRVADMVAQGYTSGELYGDDPQYKGWWEASLEEDENDIELRNEEVARLIRNGSTSGHTPTFSWSANVWKD